MVRAALKAASARRRATCRSAPSSSRRTAPCSASACNAREALGDPTAHAEILALREAACREFGDGWRLDGLHARGDAGALHDVRGRPGAGRVSRVSSSAPGSPKPGLWASLWDVVRDRRLNHRPEVQGGVLEEECADLLERFFRTQR